MRPKFALFILGCLIFLSSFREKPVDDKLPKTITRTAVFVDGKNAERTVILLDGSTSREDVIHTCSFLAKENVQLTFDKLTIGKTFLGLIGKQRIRAVEGTIQLANGSSQRFHAGGATGFRFIKIQYLNNTFSQAAQIEMIEIVD